MALSWPYRAHSHTPYWGAPNAQANFCEEDYIITPYIAEFVNTLTNITYLLYAFHGIRNNANRKDAVLRNLPYLGIAAVGFGSAIFHTTMKNYTQWCDDLSMLVAVASVVHRVYTFDKSLKTTVISGTVFTVVMTAFSIWHCITDELIMHNVIFAFMIVAVGQKTRSIISSRVENPAVAKEVRKLATWGGVIFVSGFGIWNIDNALCSSLTPWKRSIGMPWSFVLELHGWWHIFTGAGAYIFIALVEYLTSEEAGSPLGGKFAWPVKLIVDGTAGDVKQTHGDVNSSDQVTTQVKTYGQPSRNGSKKL
ncbi:related to YPC1-Alkaline Ceramidase [Rhynchosporium agropyri]|uniref:Related to YPC1-Alkaline Ceramidase n=1 Tax=Rhynchosporium agropyri TaxID=914238 RepID=A0A1E1LHU7_9HELO|nr:related to YPC1-Alkaline Ceramidase [Rhynchosporium agropyri]